MTAATVIRPLAPSEQIYAFGEVFVGYCVRVSGRLDIAALTTAFDALVAAHPTLAAQLVPDRVLGHTLVAAGPPETGLTVAEGDPELLLTGADPDQRRALSTVCVVRGPDTTSVTLLAHHSIADAVHALALFEQLWTGYGVAAAGGTPRPPATPFPVAVEELLRTRGIRKLPTPAPTIAPAESDGEPPRAEGPYPALVTSRCLLSREATAALVDFGHRVGVTVHGLVSAALLLTEAEARRVQVHDLTYSYSVDLRRRVHPPIGRMEGTNVLGFTGHRPAPDTEPTLVGLARGICGALRADLASGFIQQTPLQLPETTAAPASGRADTVMTTNWGRIPPFPAPPGLRFTDFRSTMIAKPDPTGRRRPQPGGGTSIISTYHGRLSIEIHHPPEFTPVQLPRIARLEALLGHFGSDGFNPAAERRVRGR